MNVFASAAELLRRFFRRSNGDFRRRRRFAIKVVNLSSLAVVWQLRGRAWAIALLAIVCAFALAIAAMCAIVYTPARDWLPTRLQSGLRADYETLAARMDSASARIAYNDAYTRNLMAVLFDSVATERVSTEAQPLPLDSLVAAGEAERNFMRRFEEKERYNLSVLAPVAASGMVFYNPLAAAEWTLDIAADGVPCAVASIAKGAGVSAAYRGTVVASWRDADGITLIVQHPNDFATIYRGLAEAYPKRGDRVDTGARIGTASALQVELWHAGSPLDPTPYLAL